MKATGIVRRIDDLGRIVIPKEIRKTLTIKEGDPLEIYVDKNEIFLKKYSPIVSFNDTVSELAKSLYNITNYSVMILDGESVVAGEGEAKQFLNKPISKEAVKILQEGKSFSISEDDNLKAIRLSCDSDEQFKSQLIVPILSKKQESIGIISLLDTNPKTKFGAVEIRLCKLVAEILKGKIEE